jgi:excisionase family DNA binding protein
MQGCSKALSEDWGDPLLVKPKEASRMLNCGNTRLYELLSAGELDSFLDGRSRKITVESIRRYVTRHLEGTKT